MSRKLLCLIAALLLVGTAFAPTAALADSTIGDAYLASDSQGNLALDIFNYTGTTNDAFSPDGPDAVTTVVGLSGLTLLGNGTTSLTYTFSGNADGVSLDGAGEVASFFDVFTSLTIEGTFSTTTLDLLSGGSETVNSTFSAIILDPSGLGDGDSTPIIATTKGSTGGGGVTPEPEPFIMVGTALTALAGVRRRLIVASISKFARGGF